MCVLYWFRSKKVVIIIFTRSSVIVDICFPSSHEAGPHINQAKSALERLFRPSLALEFMMPKLCPTQFWIISHASCIKHGASAAPATCSQSFPWTTGALSDYSLRPLLGTNILTRSHRCVIL